MTEIDITAPLGSFQKANESRKENVDGLVLSDSTKFEYRGGVVGSNMGNGSLCASAFPRQVCV